MSIPLIPVAVFFGLSQAGDFTFMLWLGPMIAFLLSFGISADIAYDNTAFALHVSTGVSGRDDRIGRAVACAVIALPATVLLTVLPFVFIGEWHLLAPVSGVALGVLLTGLGLSSVVSARYTYNVPLPGESPFKTPPGSTARMMLVQLGGLGVLVLLSLPELVLALIGVFTGDALWGWLALLVGVVLGVGAAGGRHRAGRPLVRPPHARNCSRLWRKTNSRPTRLLRQGRTTAERPSAVVLPSFRG